MKNITKLKRFLNKFLQDPTFISFMHSFITNLIWEASVTAAVTHVVTNGDWSWTALSAVGYAIFRTFLQEVRNYLRKRFAKPDNK